MKRDCAQSGTDQCGVVFRMHLKKQERIGLLAGVWLFEHCTSRELDALQRVATGLDVPAANPTARQSGFDVHAACVS